MKRVQLLVISVLIVLFTVSPVFSVEVSPSLVKLEKTLISLRSNPTDDTLKNNARNLVEGISTILREDQTTDSATEVAAFAVDHRNITTVFNDFKNAIRSGITPEQMKLAKAKIEILESVETSDTRSMPLPCRCPGCGMMVFDPSYRCPNCGTVVWLPMERSVKGISSPSTSKVVLPFYCPVCHSRNIDPVTGVCMDCGWQSPWVNIKKENKNTGTGNMPPVCSSCGSYNCDGFSCHGSSSGNYDSPGASSGYEPPDSLPGSGDSYDGCGSYGGYDSMPLF